MSVKTKVILITMISTVLTVLITTSILRVILINYIVKQENLDVIADYKRVHAIFQQEATSLENIVKDWAYWDNSYQFIQDGNEEYIYSNLQDSSLESSKLNFMLFVDNKGNIFLPRFYNWESQNQQILLSEFDKILKLEKEFDKLQSLSEPMTGTIMLLGKPTFISMSPVTTSDKKSPGNGIIVMGRIISEEFIKYVDHALQVKLSIADVQKSELINVANQKNLKLSAGGSEIWVRRNADEIQSFSGIKNIYGNSDMFLVLNTQRVAYKNGTIATIHFAILFFISFCMVGVSCISIMDKLIIKRLNNVHQFIDNVGISKDTKARINLPGNDEISKLAENINEMLEKIDMHYSEITIIEERFKLIMEATNDGYFDANLLTDEFYISPTWLTFIGYEDIIGPITYNHNLELIHEDDKEIFEKCVSECLSGKTENLRVEYRTRKRSGEWIWVEVRGKIVQYTDDGRQMRLMGTISDIMNRKKNEEEILFLSQTDVTTNLKNRAFMESVIKKASECKVCDYWIIMGDVNGLKLINDTFGHQEGDRLLLFISKILIKCCSNDDIPARWGGDEFIIMVKNKDKFYVENLINSIKKECEEVTDFHIKISIALGRAKKDKDNSDMDAVLKLAEERMYRHKLLESRSARSAILSSLEQSLHEKHIETEEHTKRIKHICSLIGKRMGLKQDELDELTLLGTLHDIGKIGISESILLKPDKLTEEEWKIMKTHTDIGYRIASASPELAHIANEILSHHERYDGTGYPQGLKGEEIPKLSRLINIVDSFDVMTHDRLYKKAMSMDLVIQEIKECSGKQFDPKMVESFLALLYDYQFDLFKEKDHATV